MGEGIVPVRRTGLHLVYIYAAFHHLDITNYKNHFTASNGFYLCENDVINMMSFNSVRQPLRVIYDPMDLEGQGSKNWLINTQAPITLAALS